MFFTLVQRCPCDGFINRKLWLCLRKIPKPIHLLIGFYTTKNECIGDLQRPRIFTPKNQQSVNLTEALSTTLPWSQEIWERVQGAQDSPRWDPPQLERRVPLLGAFEGARQTLNPTTTAAATYSLPHHLNSQQQPSDAHAAGGSFQDVNFQPNTRALVN